jgi:hypothetical protein
MKLKELAKKPELMKITLDSEDIVSEFGEPLDFYAYDRQPMETFLKFASMDRNDFTQMALLLKDLILDDEANPVISDGYVLPPK